jgi:hypothetical protein
VLQLQGPRSNRLFIIAATGEIYYCSAEWTRTVCAVIGK